MDERRRVQPLGHMFSGGDRGGGLSSIPVNVVPSSRSLNAVATPKPIGPLEWVAAKTKVAEMMALDKSRVFTDHPKASIGKAQYRFYLLVASSPCWLDQIKERVGHNKVACSYKTVDEFLYDVRRMCANSFLYTRATKDKVLLSFLRKLDAEDTKRNLTPSKPLVPKWQQCLALLGKLYGRVDEIYYMAYPVKAYYIANPKAEPADYAEKVKQPMDMATVVIKLLTGEYGNEGGMVADLRLMLANCRRYYTDNANLDKGTIATALSNTRVIEEALEAGLELLLPEWAGTAVPTPLGLNPKVKKHSGGSGSGSASANAAAGERTRTAPGRPAGSRLLAAKGSEMGKTREENAVRRPAVAVGTGARAGGSSGVSFGAREAAGLPMSEAQAKSMGLMRTGSEGKVPVKKLVKHLKARCERVIKSLQEARLPPKLAVVCLTIFDVPVDEDQVTDYRKLVPNKMDVGTVKDKLKNARYPHVEAFFGDLLRVYRNAVKYYEKNGIMRNKLIYEAAKALHTLASHERTEMVREFLPQVTSLRRYATTATAAAPATTLPSTFRSTTSASSSVAATVPASSSSSSSGVARVKTPSASPAAATLQSSRPTQGSLADGRPAQSIAAVGRAASPSPLGSVIPSSSRRRESVEEPSHLPCPKKPRVEFRIPKKAEVVKAAAKERAKRDEERARLFREEPRGKIEAEKEAAAKKVRDEAAAKRAEVEAATRRAREELFARKRAKEEGKRARAEEKRRAADGKKRLKEEEKRIKAEAKAEAEERKAKAAAGAQKAKAAAEKQAMTTEKAKAGTKEKVRFLKAPLPPPPPSREDVGVSVVSIPAKAPKVCIAGLRNTPGVETLLGMIRGNGSGPGIGRKSLTVRPMTAPAVSPPKKRKAKDATEKQAKMTVEKQVKAAAKKQAMAAAQKQARTTEKAKVSSEKPVKAEVVQKGKAAVEKQAKAITKKPAMVATEKQARTAEKAKVSSQTPEKAEAVQKGKAAVEKQAKATSKKPAMAATQAKAAAEKQARTTEKAKVLSKQPPKVVAKEKTRFLKAPPPPPPPSRKDVGCSWLSIPAKAPKVCSAGLRNTPGVETLLGMIRRNGFGPGIGRKSLTARPMTAPAVPSAKKRKSPMPSNSGGRAASLDKGKASAAVSTDQSVRPVDAKKRKVSRDSNDVVMWSTSRAASPFHSGQRAASGAAVRKATSSKREKGSTISLPGRGASVEPPEVDSPEPGEVLPGDLVRGKGKGKGKAEESRVEMAKGSSAGRRPTPRSSLGSAAKTATAVASLPSGEGISSSADVSLPAVKSKAGSKSSSKSWRKPSASSSIGGDICSIGGKATVKWAPRVSKKAVVSTSSTKTSKSKTRSRSPAKAGSSAAAAGTSSPDPAPVGKSTPSLVSTPAVARASGKGKRGLSGGKGKRGPAERETPAVKDGPFAPNGWGPKMTQEGTEWSKGALKNRESNREAEMLLAEEEEEEEDVDAVERVEMCYLNSKKHKAKVQAEKERIVRERNQRKNICRAMRMLSERRADEINRAMAENFVRAIEKTALEREVDAKERAWLVREFGRRENTVVGHCRQCDAERSSMEEEEEEEGGEVEASASASASSQLENQAQPEVVGSLVSLPLKGPQGSWTVASAPSAASTLSSGSLGKRKAPFMAVFKRKMGKMSAAAARRSKHPPVFASSDED